MKLSLLKASGIAVLAAGMFTGAAFAGVQGSKHDLTAATGPGGQFTPGGAEGQQICAFCHTPHAADTTQPNLLPLWNRSLTAGAYTSYSTTSIEGQTNMTGSISVACLSCHDGSTGINVLVNTPGSGSTGTWAGAWVDGGGVVSGKIASGYAFLSTDLRNDHPVGIQYGGGPISNVAGTGIPGGADAAYPSGSMKDGAFFGLKSAGTYPNQKWYIDIAGGTADVIDKTDVLLYARDGGASTAYLGTSEPFVECATCHDPHSSNATFLRVSNVGSALCLACHNK